MFSAPFVNFAVVAGEKDTRDGFAAEIVWFGVLWVFEVVAIREGFDLGGGFAAKDAWDEADDGIDDSEGWEFTAGQNEFAETDFVVDDV